MNWHLSWADTQEAARALALRHTLWNPVGVYGVPQGGSPVALMVAAHLNLEVFDSPEPGCLVVDDLVDSGATAERYLDHVFDALYRKSHSPTPYAPDATLVDGWVHFPWENTDSGPTDAVIRLLQFIGEDPTRDGLVNTPNRVVRALREMTRGYSEDAAEHLSVVFNDTTDQMIVLEGIKFTSMCEHHMLPFQGTATVGYLPRSKVVGLSKLARTVDVFAKRLQIQERLTEQIADALVDNLDPEGCGVVIRAHHSCMGIRGVNKPGAVMVTSSLRGAFLNEAAARAEFLDLARRA